jgi:hypothetical protein
MFRDVKISNISFSGSKEPTATARETHNDTAFLGFFAKTHGRWPQASFPCLNKLATSKNGRSFQLYNEDTCREFHVVVKSIIESFQDGLSRLNSYRKALRDNRGDNTPMLKNITKFNWYGHLLRRLCAGAALRTQLKNINQSLVDLLQPAPRRRRSFKAGSGGGLDAAVLDAFADAEDLEVEKGILEVDEGSEESAAEHQIPWLICLRWLKLLTAQSDAATNLAGVSLCWRTLLNGMEGTPQQSQIFPSEVCYGLP